MNTGCRPGTVSFGKYRCPNCKRWWLPNEASASFSCCVLHAPGDCCHAFETEVHKKGWVIAPKPVMVNAIGGAQTYMRRGVS